MLDIFENLYRALNGLTSKFGEVMVKLKWTALWVLVFMAGCKQYPDQQKTNLDLLTKVVDLEIKAHSAEAEIADLKNQLEIANRRISALETENPVLNSALLTPGDSTYRTVKTDLGAILVSLSDVQPYANGSQVRIFFGNTTSVNIQAPKAMFRWGSKPKDQPLDYTKGKSRTILFPREASVLRAGQWTSVVFQLDGVPPSQLDYITVEQIDWASVTL